MERRLFLFTLAGAFAVPLAAGAQQSSKLYRVGLLIGTPEAFFAPYIDTFREALHALGYVEGQNIALDWRYADDGHYDRLRALAVELTQLKMDLLVTEGTPLTRAAMQATRTIPIVMTATGDPVAVGLVTNLARPGENVTGASFFFPDFGAKRLQLLKGTIPRLRRVAVVWNPSNAVHGPTVKSIEGMAKTLGIAVEHIKIQVPADVGDALVEISNGKSALVVLEDAMINACSTQIADVAVKHGLPAIFGLAAFAEAGGLMAYGPNRVELWRRAASFVDKILRGAKPGELPVEQSVRFDMVINLKTAKALGVTIPPSLLLLADQVIE